MEDRSFMVPRHTGYNVLPNTVRTLDTLVASTLTLTADFQPIVEVRQSVASSYSNRGCTI